MKKHLYSLVTLLTMVFAFSSCEDVPEPYPIPGSGTGNTDNPTVTVEPTGTGTEADPFNVAAAIAKCKETGTELTSEVYYVKGVVKTINDSGIAQYGNINIDMVDAENPSDVFKAFQITSFGGAKFEKDKDYNINEGDVIVVKGKLYNYSGNTPETEGRGAAQLVSVNGVVGSTTPNNPVVTTAPHITIAEFLTKADTETNYELTGVVKNITSTYYGNFDLVEGDAQIYIYGLLDLNGASKKFETLGIAEGDEITIIGKYFDYNGKPEIKDAQFIKINKKGEGGGNTNPETPDTPNVNAGENLLENGDFELWDGGLPTNWKSVSTASNATLSQSTDVHGGSFAVQVGFNATQNKRLAYKEITLPAGTYVFSFYAKATTGDKSQCRPGYTTVVNGVANSNYSYGNYATLTNSEWTLVTNEFTLSESTTLCLVVMNPKTNDYAVAQNILIDDASLIKK